MKVSRPKKRLPGAVVAVYIAMIVVVLAICAIFFFIMFDNARAEYSSEWDYSDSVDEGVHHSEDELSSEEVSPDDSSSDEVGSDISSEESVSSKTPDNESHGESTDLSTDVPDRSAVSTEYVSDEDSDITVVYDDNVWYSSEFFADDLFIGDSIFTGLYLYNIIPEENVAAAIGYTPYKAMNSTFSKTYSGSAVDYAAYRQPKRIIIMLGSNTLAAGSDFDAVADTYEMMLNRLAECCPDSTLCVVSVPSVTVDSSAAKPWDIRNENIRYVNEKLEEICRKKEIYYFDLYGRLADKNGYFLKKYAEPDGMHFKSSTYSILLSGLQETLSE